MRGSGGGERREWGILYISGTLSDGGGFSRLKCNSFSNCSIIMTHRFTHTYVHCLHIPSIHARNALSFPSFSSAHYSSNFLRELSPCRWSPFWSVVVFLQAFSSCRILFCFLIYFNFPKQDNYKIWQYMAFSSVHDSYCAKISSKGFPSPMLYIKGTEADT